MAATLRPGPTSTGWPSGWHSFQKGLWHNEINVRGSFSKTTSHMKRRVVSHVCN